MNLHTRATATNTENARTPRISIVIPIYNEAGNIGALVKEVGLSLASLEPYEVIVVDDASTDDSFAEATAVANDVVALQVISYEKNRGQSAAIATGVEAANANIVAVLDGDGQNDPADIVALYDVIASNPGLSMVAGERAHRHDNWIRRVSSRVANSVRRIVLHDGCNDTGCALKVFRRDAFLRLPQFDHMHRFLPALFIADGGEVEYQPVTHRPRIHGESKYGVRNRLWVGIVDLIGVFWLGKRRLE